MDSHGGIIGRHQLPSTRRIWDRDWATNHRIKVHFHRGWVGLNSRREEGLALAAVIIMCLTAVPSAALPATAHYSSLQLQLLHREWAFKEFGSVGLRRARLGLEQLRGGGPQDKVNVVPSVQLPGTEMSKRGSSLRRELLTKLTQGGKIAVGLCGLMWCYGCVIGLWSVFRASVMPGGYEWMQEQSSHGVTGIVVFVIFTSFVLLVQLFKLWNLIAATTFSEVRQSFMPLAIFNVYFVYMCSLRYSPSIEEMCARDLIVLGETFCLIFVVFLVWLKQPWRGKGRKMKSDGKVRAIRRSVQRSMVKADKDDTL